MTNQRIPSRFRGNVQAYFARHAQTLVGSLGRMVNQPFATLMTMSVVAVALALPLFLNLFLANVRSATGNLDPDLALEIMNLFRRFNEVGVTVVIATHDVHLIEHVGARRIVLGDGRVTEAGGASERVSAQTRP